MRRLGFALSVAAASVASFGIAVAAAPPGTVATALPSLAVPACTAKQLTLAVPDTAGRFSGMSHDGLIAVVTNVSGGACSIARRPAFSLVDAHMKVAGIAQAAPNAIGMHPGPVTIPVMLLPQASALATLRWVSSDAYGANHCASATGLVYTFAPALTRSGTALPLVAPVRVRACGPAAPAPIAFETSVWQIRTVSPEPSASASP